MPRPTNDQLRGSLIEGIKELRRLRDEKDRLEKDIDGVQGESISLLDRLGFKSIAFDTDSGSKITGTKVEPTALEFDEVKLKKKIGIANWNRVTTKVLDRKKLEAAVAEGHISPATVASCASEIPRKPYIRVTEKG